MMMKQMRVVKRDGSLEEVSFDKVLRRLKQLSSDLNINVYEITQQVCQRIHDKINTSELDELAASFCSSLFIDHPDYGKLSSRLIISNHHKKTSPSFSETINILYWNNDTDNTHMPLVSKDIYEIVMKNKEKLNDHIKYERDYLLDYFGFKTLERSYLIKANNICIERPQHMWMRVALGIHREDIKDVLETYDLLSQKYFTHATPTLFNAGTNRNQCSSCFLMGIDDSIKGIYECLQDCALISKYAGGIGIHVQNIRASGSKIKGTNGTATGIVPMLRVFNATARYVDQGSKRFGSIAIYIEPWHADIFDFLELRKNHGNEEFRCRDLFTALWIPDLFMKRVQDNDVWSLMCPNMCPGLDNCYGEEFELLYNTYEVNNNYIKQIKAQDLWFAILQTQVEQGVPYIAYKDAVNKKSNQKNLGVIKSSNLCVAPDTLILTDKGYFKIKDLEGETVNIWNGEIFSCTTIVKTGLNKKLINVIFSNGTNIKCTPYHKFHIKNNKRSLDDINKTDIIEAKDLVKDMKIIDFSYPVINNNNDLSDAYIRGLICGVDNDKLIKKSINVPINYNIKSKLSFIQGYLYSGIVIKVSDYIDIQYDNVSLEFMKDFNYMLNTLGISCDITYNDVINRYNSLLKNNDLIKLYRLGFSTNMVDLSSLKEYDVYSNDIKIVKIEDNNEYDDTYCFNEPLRNMGIFNGILAGNCIEIMQYSDHNETAVCNLSSICLPTFIENNEFNFKKLHDIVKVITKNINKIIDNNFYPIEKARKSNLKHRPMGIGIQGLADTFMLLKLPFESDESKELNKKIFATIYHSALEYSCELAKKRHDTPINELILNEYEKDIINTKYPGSYISFEGSPASKGVLQFDLWGKEPDNMYDWNLLKDNIKLYGLRNSLFVAPMPTASTAQIMGFNESFEPITNNIYKRRVLSGEFIVINKYLIKDLIDLNLWNNDMKEKIMIHDGSVQNINEIPNELKELYKTSWEMKQKNLIDMSLDRGIYVCQSQSLNIFMNEPDFKKLTSMHFYSWSNGAKVSNYYIRTRAKSKIQKFTIDPEKERKILNENKKQKIECNDEVCVVCSS